MSMIRPFAWLAALVVGLIAVSPAHAQHYTPFIDPGYFQPDFQLFAPAEVSDFGDGEPPNTGIYVTYDRTYVNVTRPDDVFSFGSEHQGDFTWGNRYEIGYMTEERSGWQGVLWHVNGPNENFVSSEFFELVNGAIGTTAVTLRVPQPLAVDSMNNFKLSSFELNKTWRRKEFHNGAVLEPLLGYRYMNAKDFFQRQSAVELEDPAVGANEEFFLIDTLSSVFENQMHGGQLGGRLFHQRGHWLLSLDVKFFAMANFQSLSRMAEQATVLSPNADEDLEIIVLNGQDIVRQRSYDRATEFVWGGEVKGEAAYELTREICLRVGFVFFDLGKGIGRGNDINLNNQDVQMAGLTFGFTVNR